MLLRDKILTGIPLLLAIGLLLISGCGPRPPIPYQQLQVQDSSESVGYDVYMYVAVEKGLAAGDVEDLLEWFRDVKFPEENKIRILVWNNPQSALISAMGDKVGEMTVDRANDVDNIQVGPG